MKYLCLIYYSEAELDTRPAAEQEQVWREAGEHHEDLVRSGRHVLSAALQPTAAAVTVRVRDGRMSATEGPFAETREQLGGFFLIEARDLNEAMQAAEATPGARLGCVEIRPLRTA
jgi:hypothetical protein